MYSHFKACTETSDPQKETLCYGRDPVFLPERYIMAVFSLLFLLTCGGGGVPAATVGHPIVEVIPVELDPETPNRKHLGRLTFLSGFELRSADFRFGGVSDLVLDADGSMLYAISDRGYWLSASIRHDTKGHLKAIGPWEITPLLTPERTTVSGWMRDAEGLARDRDGSFIVSFEYAHRLWRYPPPPAAFSSPPQSLPTPAELAMAPSNGGLEAVTVLLDGRLLVLTEQYENPDGSLKGWLIEKDRFAVVSYLPLDGFQPTALVTLAGGDVLVLERRHSWLTGWAARITRLSRASLKAGARLKGKEIARLERPLVVDNFEGIAVRDVADQGTFIYLISDDNFSPFQHTLLLQFRLEADGN